MVKALSLSIMEKNDVINDVLFLYVERNDVMKACLMYLCTYMPASIFGQSTL